jgi:hypothetical protein
MGRMSRTEGVPLDQLCCPTCGLRFRDYNLYSEEEEFFPAGQLLSPILAFAIGKKYLRCPDSHKWSVKTIWRSVHYPDHIQLGEYLGTTQWD